MKKGEKHSELRKKQIGESKKGNKYFFGKKHTLEARQKIREARAKQIMTEETRKKISEAGKGRKYSLETRKKISEGLKGKNGGGWKGGLTSINILIRTSAEYKLWRKAVFERDDYTCIWCGAKNGHGREVVLNADHIKPFSLFPELRFAIDNGRTLCVNCHKTTDTYGGKILAIKHDLL